MFFISFWLFLLLFFLVIYVRYFRLAPLSFLPEALKDFLSFDLIEINKHDAWGQIGDYFGGVLNPLFSLITIGIVLYTYIKTTKHQLKNTLDTKFLSLINSNREILKNIRTENNLSGIDAMEQLVSKIYEGCGFCLFNSINKEQPTIEQVSSAYEHWYGYHGYVKYLGHYFRNLDHIVKYIENSRHSEIISESDAQDYINLLLSYLNDDELILLFFNGLSTYGTKFKIFIEKYSMLENLSFAGIAGANANELKLGCGIFKLYDVSAYGTWSGKQPGFSKPEGCAVDCYPIFTETHPTKREPS